MSDQFFFHYMHFHNFLKGLETDRFSIPLFTPQMAARARVGSGHMQKARLNIHLPQDQQGPVT